MAGARKSPAAAQTEMPIHSGGRATSATTLQLLSSAVRARAERRAKPSPTQPKRRSQLWGRPIFPCSPKKNVAFSPIAPPVLSIIAKRTWSATSRPQCGHRPAAMHSPHPQRKDLSAHTQQHAGAGHTCARTAAAARRQGPRAWHPQGLDTLSEAAQLWHGMRTRCRAYCCVRPDKHLSRAVLILGIRRADNRDKGR